MAIQILEHTADLRMKISASCKEELFSEAVAALMGQLKGSGPNMVPVLRKVTLSSVDQTSLLIDFLNELHGMGQVNREVYMVKKISRLTDTEVDAVVEGRPVDSFGNSVKSVTYHEAEMKRNDRNQWEVTIVLDV